MTNSMAQVEMPSIENKEEIHPSREDSSTTTTSFAQSAKEVSPILPLIIKQTNEKRTLVHSILKRNLFSLPVVLLSFPTFSILFAAIGFLFRIPITALWALLGFGCASLLAIFGGGTFKQGFKRLGWFFLITFLVFIVDQSFIFFSWWDTQAYHIPATQLLIDGWNPVFTSTHEALTEFIAQHHLNFSPDTFNIYHTAYLPRAGWIWNAICWTFSGNIELGDSLILITAIALGGIVWRLTPIFFGLGRWKRHLFSWLILLSPGIYIALFCGAHDGALYALLLIFAFAACAYRKTGATEWLSFLVITPIIGCNLKFTGVINFTITAFIFTIPLFWSFITKKRKPKKFWKWMAACSFGFFIALLVGFSPYLTNWVNKGSPFYPEHTFSEDVETLKMTEDFNLCNNDAKMLNYFSRTTRAYFSQALTDKYYQYKIDHDDTLPNHRFEPIFHLDQVNGLGAGFRAIMILTLIVLCVTRRCTTPWLLLSIVATSLLVPTKMVGYVRYVPQFWIVPMILALNAMTANTSKSPWVGRILGIFIITILLSASVIVALGKVLLSFSMSAYALSMVERMQEDEAPRLYILSREDRYKEDGRCLAAWRQLPPDIPSPHLFDAYNYTMLYHIGIQNPVWLTYDEMVVLREDSGDPYFPINEHLWYWCTPRTTNDPKHDLINFENYCHCGIKKEYPITPRQFGRMSATILPQLPRYLWDITAFRIKQMFRHYTHP